MDREHRLKHLASEYWELTVKERGLKSAKEELRKELFRLIDDYEYAGKDHLLPVRTIEVPDSFWHTTDMTMQEFAETRYPGWNVEHVEKNIAQHVTVFVFKKDPKYMPKLIEVDDLRLSKSVNEYTPEIDWDSLDKERPDLFERLAEPHTIYEINEQAFETLLNENPDELNTIQRHMKTKNPTVKVVPRLVKNDE